MNLKHYILPGNCTNYDVDMALHNETFHYWKSFWQKVYKDNGAQSIIKIEDFFRQNYIGILTHDQEIVGLYSSTLFHLEQDSATEHPYFQSSFNQQYIESLRARGVTSCVSAEYLTVAPSWRKIARSTKISIAEVIVGLQIQLFRSLDVDAAVAIVREDVKIHEMAYRWGYYAVQTGIVKHNTPCQLIACSKNQIKWHPDENLNRMVKMLWSGRISMMDQRIYEKKAA
ncbi:MAG: hypothetical protein AB7F59_02480 [Bdellovibrionales bacterium]